MKVSVILCAYTENRWNALVSAIESIQQQTRPADEIIVVIDHNPPLLMRAQEHLQGIIAIENREAKGASGARNSGIAASHGEIIVFLDDDAIAASSWLQHLVECYNDPTVVGVGGKIDPLWLSSKPRWFPEEFNWVVGCTYRGMPTKNAEVRNVIGANMSVRRTALELVGGFRESFGNNKADTTNTAAGMGSKWLHHQAGDEETELCIRISQALSDAIWLYAVSARVRHQVPSPRTRWSYFLWRCYDEGLGKAVLASIHDRGTSLSAERAYTFRVLPGGVLYGLSDILRGDITGPLRAGAIIGGFSATLAGYALGSIVARRSIPASHLPLIVDVPARAQHASLAPAESSAQ